MKTFSRVIIALLVAFTVIILPILVYVEYQAEVKIEHSIYPLTVRVVELDHDTDVVVCVDGANNFWEFYGVEDWQIGDYASLLMDDNATPNSIYDDVITMTLYAGTFEG